MTGEAAPFFRPLSWLYRAATAIHGASYDAGLCRSTRLPEPVLSLGNLVAGGTGKTPATIWLARRLKERGFHPAVLSRGYGRTGSDPLLIAPTALPPSPGMAGDEPLEMARALPGIPIAVSRDRPAAARLVRAAGRVDVWLLDDGFQHRPLERDANIVLLDAAAPFGNGRLLPAGPLREPPGALRRADVVVLTRAEAVRDPRASREAVRRHIRQGVPLFLAEHRLTGLVALAGAGGPAPGAGTEVVATAGIARPEAFGAALAAAGWRLGGLVPFPDHRAFDAADVAAVEAAAAGRPIVTTAKDAVRWEVALGGTHPGWWVAGLEFTPREPEALVAAILACLERGPGQRKGAGA